MIISLILCSGISAVSIWFGWQLRGIYDGNTIIRGIPGRPEPKPEPPAKQTTRGRDYRKRIVRRGDSIIEEIIEREFS